MRPFTYLVFNVPFRSGLVAIVLSMNVTVVALCQEHESNPAAKIQPETELAIGTEVVFKSSHLPVGDVEQQAQSTIHPP
ncbi:MAG TPA: hypothetical protein VHS97_15485, partial [Isosphaeraceae bacterium]|nr:hypothetical protein [Isosphaeraceae bacterium]